MRLTDKISKRFGSYILALPASFDQSGRRSKATSRCSGPSSASIRFKYNGRIRGSQRTSDGMSLQLASLLKDIHRQGWRKLPLVSQQICYDRGENRRGCLGSLDLAPRQPHTGVDPLGRGTRSSQYTEVARGSHYLGGDGALHNTTQCVAPPGHAR